MKLIDYSKPTTTPGFLQRLIERLQVLLPFWTHEKLAHERLVAQLRNGLDNRFFLFKNLPLDNPHELTPYILAGPSGLTVLNVSIHKGIYRAKDDSLWEMSKTSQQYQPAHQNLIKQTQALAQRLATALDQQGRTHPVITPVLIFMHPGVNIESSLPAVRIVRVDGIRRLAANLLQGDEVLPTAEVRLIADALDRIANPEQSQKVLGEDEDFFGKDLIQPEEKKPVVKTPIPVPQLNLPPVLEKMGLSKNQWIIVSGLTIITMLVLAGLIFFVLFTA
jgi:hypothetical protein